MFLSLKDILSLERVNKDILSSIRNDKTLWNTLKLQDYATVLKQKDIINLTNRATNLRVLILDGIEFLEENAVIQILSKCSESLKELSFNLIRYYPSERELLEKNSLTRAETMLKPNSLFLLTSTIVHHLPLQIQSLGLAYRIIDKKPFHAMISRLTMIKHLDLRMTGITNDDLQLLLKERGTQLESLKLMELQLSDLTLIFFALYAKNMRHLELDYCFNRSCTSRKLGAVIQAMKLECIKFERITFSSTDTIVEKLENCTSFSISPWDHLHSRDSYVDLTTSSFQTMAISSKFERLREVRFVSCKFMTDKDLVLIVQLRRATLQFIDVRKCPLIGFDSLTSMFTNHMTSLQQLILHDLEKLKNEIAFIQGTSFKDFVVYRQLRLISLKDSLPAKMIDDFVSSISVQNSRTKIILL